MHTTLFEADLIGRLAAGLARVPVVSSLVNVAYGPEQAKQGGCGFSEFLGRGLPTPRRLGSSCVFTRSAGTGP